MSLTFNSPLASTLTSDLPLMKPASISSATPISRVLSLGKSLEGVEIDGLILDTVDVLETKLRKTALERHLTTFETNLLAVTRTRLGTLMTAGEVPPSPEPGPRPIRLRVWVEPLAGLRVCNFIMSLRFGLFYYCYQVVNLANHTASASIVFEFYNMVELSETKRIESTLLIYGRADTAASLLNLNLCHVIIL